MSDFWDKQKEVKTITKNKSENVVISHCSRNNKNYLDVRIHKKAKDSDTYIPTSKGFNIELKNTVGEEIIEGISQVLTEK